MEISKQNYLIDQQIFATVCYPSNILDKRMKRSTKKYQVIDLNFEL